MHVDHLLLGAFGTIELGLWLKDVGSLSVNLDLGGVILHIDRVELAAVLEGVEPVHVLKDEVSDKLNLVPVSGDGAEDVVLVLPFRQLGGLLSIGSQMFHLERKIVEAFDLEDLHERQEFLEELLGAFLEVVGVLFHSFVLNYL
tara:strand:+ start:370 stop:801 length:432 start_codon:yes stop_codon:yes gene_type:complete